MGSKNGKLFEIKDPFDSGFQLTDNYILRSYCLLIKNNSFYISIEDPII